MKITTWNVNGIRARELQVLDWVAREHPDVLCLQEIKASPEHIPPALCALPGYWCYWHGFKGYSGVAIHLSREAFPSPPAFGHPAFDLEHRIVTVSADDLVLASIYVPNGNKDYPAKITFLEGLARFVDESHRAGRRLVLCGDLNVALEDRDVHPKLRNPRQIGQTDEEQALLRKILSLGLVDLLRRYHPDDNELYTWWAPWRNMRERNIGWRLDYILASEAIAAQATGCDSFREFGSSDHGPVSAVFEGSLVAVSPGDGQPPPEAGPRQLALF